MSIQGQILNMQYPAIDEIVADSVRVEKELTTLRAQLADAHSRNLELEQAVQSYHRAHVNHCQLEAVIYEKLAARDAEVARLREALQPFAEAVPHVIQTLPDSTSIWHVASNGRIVAEITLGDVRKARKALEGKPAQPTPAPVEGLSEALEEFHNRFEVVEGEK